MAKCTRRPASMSTKGIYEIDELWTYVGKKEKEAWITYSLDRHSGTVIDFKVGSRTKENLQAVVISTLAFHPIKVCTDGLNTYRSLVPNNLHRIGLPHTRRIERFNLNLRTHLKRLEKDHLFFAKSDYA